jgi:hypothetical protein
MWCIYWDPCGFACFTLVSRVWVRIGAELHRTHRGHGARGLVSANLTRAARPTVPLPSPPSQGIATVLLVDWVTVFYVVKPWFGLDTPVGLAHILPFQIVIALIITSYVKAATTDPGSVEMNTATEDDIIPPMTDAEKLINLKLKRRFCHKCKCIKPPRAHHCSTCNRCINKMGECAGGGWR